MIEKHGKLSASQEKQLADPKKTGQIAPREHIELYVRDDDTSIKHLLDSHKKFFDTTVSTNADDIANVANTGMCLRKDVADSDSNPYRSIKCAKDDDACHANTCSSYKGCMTKAPSIPVCSASKKM